MESMDGISHLVVGFDIDGTLTTAPEMFKKLIWALRWAGVRCIVITGCLSGSPTTHTEREEQLKSIGITYPTYYDLLCVVEGNTTDEVAALKGKICARQRVGLMFEDTAAWAPIIKRESPNTTVVLIT